MADVDLMAVTRWLLSSEFLWNALVLIGVVVVLKVASQMLSASLAETIKRAFTTNWQLTVLATSAFLLSVASGWRTWDGMSQFTGD
jgi:NADH:ubiquinone oxidoreductase subunit 6 (subunit J)